ncbi:protein BPS1, chloroplastic-like [Pistacia vera]|uniref:protein BPS1, chloroplastic-like n=1 Tax=Pistacia vera TaxID=55513 RepID=UPI0012636F5D|nr:protein BPS1, chloroplastic-like [Pistacia vera]
MKPSSILRSLSSLVRLSASSAVVPLPITSSFDEQVTAHLDGLQLQKVSQIEQISFLLHALDASTTTQQLTLDALANVHIQDSYREVIDKYLDYNTKMLDTCNELSEKIEIIQKYLDSLRIVSHLLEGNGEPHQTTLARAGDVLDSCQELERRCNEIEKCNSGLRKSFSFQKVNHCETFGLGEILSGSMAVTSMVCAILGVALSFNSKRSLPSVQAQSFSSSWSYSLKELQKQVKEQKKSGSGMMLVELQHSVVAARALRDQIKRRKQSEVELDVGTLKTNCGKLEESIEPLEERVKDLYKELINVRMALLGKLSQI